MYNQRTHEHAATYDRVVQFFLDGGWETLKGWERRNCVWRENRDFFGRGVNRETRETMLNMKDGWYSHHPRMVRMVTIIHLSVASYLWVGPLTFHQPRTVDTCTVVILEGIWRKGGQKSLSRTEPNGLKWFHKVYNNTNNIKLFRIIGVTVSKSQTCYFLRENVSFCNKSATCSFLHSDMK